MTLGLLFWTVYTILLFIGCLASYDKTNYRLIAGHFALMTLTFLLGWGTFGPIVHK